MSHFILGKQALNKFIEKFWRRCSKFVLAIFWCIFLKLLFQNRCFYFCVFKRSENRATFAIFLKAIVSIHSMDWLVLVLTAEINLTFPLAKFEIDK